MKAHISQAKKKTVLLYGLPPEQQSALAAIFEKEGTACRSVAENETAATLAQLLDGGALPPAAGALSVTGKFAVLDGFENEELRAAAAQINSICPGVIKAARTAHNSGWSFHALCQELAAEHEAMTGGKS